MNLRTARKRAGLSQKQLEAKSGVDQPTISRIENGASPMFETVCKLANALDIEPGQLCFGLSAVQA